MPVTLDKLLAFRAPRATPRVRLVCFPFAGGAASVFRAWGNLLPDDVDVCLVELPGRGTRYGEPLLQDPQALLEELSVLRALPALPTVFFGHSLGGSVAFSLIRRGLRADALIVSASRPPHVAQPKLRSALPKEALVRELRRLGGTPKIVLDDPDMLDLMLPVVRADFRILETLVAAPAETIPCPLSVLAASDDVEVPLADVEKWKMLAGGTFRLSTVEGGHFYLVAHPEKALSEVRRVLHETAGS